MGSKWRELKIGSYVIIAAICDGDYYNPTSQEDYEVPWIFDDPVKVGLITDINAQDSSIKVLFDEASNPIKVPSYYVHDVYTFKHNAEASADVFRTANSVELNSFMERRAIKECPIEINEPVEEPVNEIVNEIVEIEEELLL